LIASSKSIAACITSPATFAQWYRKDPANTEVVGLITLFDNGIGGFVNRFGPNGEQWVDAAGQSYDGSPLFFPIDGKGKQAPTYPTPDAPSAACVPGKYGKPPTTWDATARHNFHFTSEVTHWFKYDASKPATLAFTGDDDVWVFLNGVLAVDIGGVHQPSDGSVSINPTTAGQFGLVNGNVYPIKVFQAERKICGSSFRLTLGGFATGRSACAPQCGDGIVELGEECDDGINDGGYGECGPGCKLTEFCGDGIVQAGEDCDDGNTIDGDACPSSCRIVVPK
jgi:fibro-slime domain-containing protein